MQKALTPNRVFTNWIARHSFASRSRTMSSGLDQSQWPQENSRPMARKQLSSGPLAVAKFFVGMFSDFERQRDPPESSKTQHARLITIQGSHYCEKGRWIMDRVEADPNSPIYYTEDPHPPGFHAFASVAASGDQGSITPCLLLDSATDGEKTTEFIADSSVMMRRFLPSLYPSDIKEQVIAMEDLIGAKLGPSVRVFAYHTLLQPRYQPIVIRIMSSQATKVEQFFFRKMLPVGIASAMKKSMKITDETAEISKQAIGEVFAMVSERLEASGGDYLMDTPEQSYGFTAADLTFAALASSLTRPKERLIFNIKEDDELPPEYLAFTKELSESRAGKHVNEMYAKHRLTSQDENVVSIKCVDRNALPIRFG